jgi:uncharacterized protein YjbI with pentapeptide repeats
MANPEHVAVVLKGAHALLEWTRRNRETGQVQDLDVTEADLKDVDISGTNFYKARFSGANLFHANFYEATITDSDLSNADLSWTDMCSGDLSGCNFVNANLQYANLRSANLSGADLIGADLSFAILTATNLSMTNLSKTNLYGANFFFTELKKTNFSEAIANVTLFSACDLSQCVGLETVKHPGPSSIGCDTLIQSFHEAGDRFPDDLKSFFLDSGVPAQILETIARENRKRGKTSGQMPKM